MKVVSHLYVTHVHTIVIWTYGINDSITNCIPVFNVRLSDIAMHFNEHLINILHIIVLRVIAKSSDSF